MKAKAPPHRYELHSAAWHEGWRAFFWQKPQSANPYTLSHVRCAREWRDGFMAAGDVHAQTPSPQEEAEART